MHSIYFRTRKNIKLINYFMGFIINKNVSSNEKLNKPSQIRWIQGLCRVSLFAVSVDFSHSCQRQISKRNCCINEPKMTGISTCCKRKNLTPSEVFPGKSHFDFWIINLDCCTRVCRSHFALLFNRKLLSANELIFAICYSVAFY